jgi:hypothetical protein
MRSHLSLPPSLRVLPVAAHLSLKKVTNIERSSGAMRFPFYRDAAARYSIIFAWAFRRSAQYRFMRWETALRPAADIRLVRFVACSSERRSARRRCGSASSGNVRSIAMISARSLFNATSAPVRASSRNRSVLSLPVLGMCSSLLGRSSAASIKLFRLRNRPPRNRNLLAAKLVGV